eukprot:TRINITY_DN3412_c0_g1_i1.p1 TRINITY_DN3412_c0_g1~~TRINITY_DN3412_c0_g1_i1.p1  ORF type:complete len:323 (+),score=103.54 TRINITY_DN3412_c0_g1_i1:93-1061(+)
MTSAVDGADNGKARRDSISSYASLEVFSDLSEEDKKVLLDPFKYLTEIPGKGVRALLVKGFQKWLQIDRNHLESVAKIVEMLHNASLLIDDIEDNSKLRRGVPVAHLIYGVPLTINSANYVYFAALRECAALGNPQAVSVFTEELLALHHGQGFDIFWRDHSQCPTEDQYKQMVLEKTGGLFRLAVRLMQAFSTNKTDFVPLVNYLGLYFQIRDDYINLQSEEYMKNKSFAEDLTEGKFSFPIIHSIRSQPHDHRLINIVKQRTTDVELKKYAVSVMEQSGSFEYTRKVVTEYKDLCLAEIKRLGGNADLQGIVEYLAASNK